MNKRSLIGLTVALCLWGCNSRLPAPADSTIATTSLNRALEVWKSGAEITSLKDLDPPIYFNDQIWRQGNALTGFTVTPGSANGQGWNCEVMLKTASKQGSIKDLRVSYQIDTAPHIVIVQQP